MRADGSSLLSKPTAALRLEVDLQQLMAYMFSENNTDRYLSVHRPSIIGLFGPRQSLTWDLHQSLDSIKFWIYPSNLKVQDHVLRRPVNPAACSRL
ncbi:hypothetical protein OPV22_011292 [Ensete ventricosum]|uniref:Uncharacterized protein n=1 Tax=Ensete ventricosum TaxID=4639 RepID=A0AAV8PWX5_ENSVE|nr:hypothetical protein OPV22_011292 [Ensete ventricosum]